RRSTANLTGFQRPVDDTRVNKAKVFFDFPDNQSPTALIVGLHPNLPNAPFQAIVDRHTKVTDSIWGARLSITMPDTLSTPDAAEVVRQQLLTRVPAPDGARSPELDTDELDIDELDDELMEDVLPGELDETPDDDGDDDLADTVGLEVELGRSVLDSLL